MCSSPICLEKHLVFYHIFPNFFEFSKFKTENTENFRNSIFQLLAETEFFPVFRRYTVGKFFPGRAAMSRGEGTIMEFLYLYSITVIAL